MGCQRHFHPKWSPISPGPIAIYPETVYNVDARTRDFWVGQQVSLLSHMADAVLKHATGDNTYCVTTESIFFSCITIEQL